MPTQNNKQTFTEGCMVCGKELSYTDAPSEKKCYFCKNELESNVDCPDHHFVCDSCHSSSANELILGYCAQTELENPVEIANLLMSNQKIKMHGAEHHFLVPAVLLAAYYNKLGKPAIKKRKLLIAYQRADQVPGGFCGTHGNCGAAVGSGIFMSVVTGATPLSREDWQSSNLLTATCLYQVAMSGGPRCCKRDTFISINETVTFIKDNLKVELPVSEDILCSYAHRNKQCIEKACQFYNG